MLTLRGSTIVGAAILIWMVWIFLATSQTHRIERICQPVLWTGNVFTSLVALTAPKYQDHIESGFASADYGCRYTVWRLLFEDKYIKQRGAHDD